MTILSKGLYNIVTLEIYLISKKRFVFSMFCRRVVKWGKSLYLYSLNIYNHVVESQPQLGIQYDWTLKVLSKNYEDLILFKIFKYL